MLYLHFSIHYTLPSSLPEMLRYQNHTFVIDLGYWGMCWKGDRVPVVAGLVDLRVIGMVFAREAENILWLLWAVPTRHY